MYQGPIIDTHHHLFELKDHPWLLAPPSPKIFGESYEPLRRDYLIDDLLADFGGNRVVKSVHVQAHRRPEDPVDETRWLQSIADVHGYPHAITGSISTGLPCKKPSLKAIAPAILKAISDESTGWNLPSKSTTRTFTTG